MAGNPPKTEVLMLRFGTPAAEWLQELLLIGFGTLLLFALGALILGPRGHRAKIIESLGLPKEPHFDPRKNGRGTFFPWVPIA